jgi:heme-degrading monooxygenase HmoA
MWAQLIKSRVKPGKEEEARNLSNEFEAEAQGATPPWISITTCANTKDPSEFHTLVIFESEEKARENERSPEQQKRVQRLMDVYEGQPEFIDLDVVYHGSR